MAKVWFAVLVLLIAENVFANICESEINSCDQCIRCGATWCSERTDKHCTFTKTDEFCGGRPENLTKIDEASKNGEFLYPNYMERTIVIGSPDRFSLSYISPVKRTVKSDIYDTTQNFGSIAVKPFDPICSKGQCTQEFEAAVDPDFCTSRGTVNEFIYIQLKVDNITESTLIKYHVPCACECSKVVERKSPKCSGNGDLSCGICKCYKDWHGEDCSILECGSMRGDIQCNNPLKNDEECSGNGYCGTCNTCICYDDREGSQYFDSENYCSDICMESSAFGHCLTNKTLGECADAQLDVFRMESVHRMIKLEYNETTSLETEYDGKKIWVRCNDTFSVGTENGKCKVEYFAMKSEDGLINVMVLKLCDQLVNDQYVAGTVNTKVPIILGVLGILAAIAAVGGVLLWKHFNSVPPMPFSSPDYQNIDAEDCVGENPLYKSPTSTFTNPQFGKC